LDCAKIAAGSTDLADELALELNEQEDSAPIVWWTNTVMDPLQCPNVAYTDMVGQAVEYVIFFCFFVLGG
jgi:hypothetical protein